MSKTTQRRERKLARELREYAVSDPVRFKKEWGRLLQAWSAEAYRRGHLLSRETGDNRRVWVFGVLRKAERLLRALGPEAERLVGAKTRELLSHDCGRAFAAAVEPGLYKPGNGHHNEVLMKLGTHKPPR